MWVDAGGLSGAREQNSAEAGRVLSYSLHLNAAVPGNGGLAVLCSRCTWSQLDGHFVRRQSAARPTGTIGAAEPRHNKQAHKAENLQRTSHLPPVL